MQQRAADLLQWARRAGNIDRLRWEFSSSGAAAAAGGRRCSKCGQCHGDS